MRGEVANFHSLRCPSARTEMPTYKLTIEFEGTRYSGWQEQGNTARTIQGNLMRAAAQVFGSDVDIGGAGRTDAGVHAAGQVAHLRSARVIPAELVSRKINDLLPHDIHILSAEQVAPGFHARHDALVRIYLYQISTRRSAFAKPFIWWIKDRLDVASMSQAAVAIAGRHDFTAFSDKRMKADDSRIVVVERIEVALVDDLILIRMAASHYVWKMVRKIVAALVEVGRGNWSSADFAARLEPGAPISELTAPPSGLFLEAITYPGELFDRPLEALVPVTTPRLTRAVGTSAAEAPRQSRRPKPKSKPPTRSRDGRGGHHRG
jgi:tRNA pseudouridine38-40 synthase